MKQLKMMEGRIYKRLNYLEEFNDLPSLNEIHIVNIDKRRIIRVDQTIKAQVDWEYSLSAIEKDHNLPPSVFIGDLGFFVDLDNENRDPEEFKGLFLMADDPFYEMAKDFDYLPQGDWLTVYIRGDHQKAAHAYGFIKSYAKEHSLQLTDMALERTLMDHVISTDPNDYVTEIQILIKKQNEHT
jgi:effector-binding domain-containing protein